MHNEHPGRIVDDDLVDPGEELILFVDVEFLLSGFDEAIDFRMRSLPQQSQLTGITYWRLWRDLRRFRRDGLLGLIDRRTLPHARGKPAEQDLLPRHIQQHIVRLAIAHPFTYREMARIVWDGYR